MAENIESKAFIVRREGGLDLSFRGWYLAKDLDGWPEVRLYKSETGKYIFKETDEEQTVNIEIFQDLDSLVQYIVGRFGEYSDVTKSLFRQAGPIEPELLKYAIEEI